MTKQELNCKNKRRYPDETIARAHTMYRAETDRVELAVYKCPVCGGYHMTHQTCRDKWHWK